MDRIDKSILTLAVSLLAYELFLPPVVGMANNGDFGKLIARFNLGAPFENEFRYAATKYNYDAKYHYESGVYSSELILVPTALGLSALVSRTGTVDIRCMGAIHGALFLLALYLLLPVLRNLANWVRISILLLIVLIFCDLAYTSLFNSFYMDAGAFLALMLGAVLLIRAMERPSIADAAGFVACCVFLITTKPQHCLLALPLSVFVLWKGETIWPGSAIRFKSVAAGAMLGAILFTWRTAPPEYEAAPLYTMIFTGVLPGSKDPMQDLKAMGLDDTYMRYHDTNGFTTGNPLGDEAFVKQFKQRTSYARLGYFFLTHPSTGYRVICNALGQAGRQKPNLGNYDQSAGKYPWAESRAFILWSRLKRSLFYWKGARYLLYFLGVMLSSALVAATRASKAYIAPAALVTAMALTEMGVAALGDAAEVTRHFFLFNALLDLLFVSAIASALALPSRGSSLPRRQLSMTIAQQAMALGIVVQ